jgi:hypothetical protein
VLKTSAIDMDDPTPALDAGFDFSTGFDLIQADGALSQLPALLVEVQPAASQVSCQGAHCRLHVTCILPQGLQEQCRNEVNLFVPARSVRLKGDTARAPRRIRLAGAVAKSDHAHHSQAHEGGPGRRQEECGAEDQWDPRDPQRRGHCHQRDAHQDQAEMRTPLEGTV